MKKIVSNIILHYSKVGMIHNREEWKMKTLVSWVLILALLLSGSPVMLLRTNAAEDLRFELWEEPAEDPVECLTYFRYGDGVLIEDCDPAASGDLVIPETLGGYPVKGITFSAFDNCYLLDSITIPASVTDIHEGAFMDSCLYGIYVDEENPAYCNDQYGALYSKDMTRLLMVPGMYEGSYQVPASVTQIDSWAFTTSSMLTKIVVNEANEYYSSDDRGVLFNKDKTILLTAPGGITGSYTIPQGVTYIEWGFISCYQLTEVVIPEGVTEINPDTFQDCISLETVWIPKTVVSMTSEVFRGCWSLQRIEVDKQNTTYRNDERGVLYSDSWLIKAPAALSGSYTVPGNITIISNYAFESCAELTEITFGKEPTNILYERATISPYAFADCFSLHTVYLGANVSEISYEAFSGCDALQDVYYGGTEALWKKVRITTGNECLTAATVHYGDFGGIEPETPDEPEEPDILTYLQYTVQNGEATITGCHESASGDITLPATIDQCPVTAIGMNAFLWCENITRITVPEGVKTVGMGAFQGCAALTDVYLPASLTDLSTQAFGGCQMLTGIWVAEDNARYWSDDWGVVFSKDQTVLVQAPTGITECYMIPESVTEIGDFAFSGCAKLSDVILSESLERIGQDAFSCCRQLVSVYIPDSVTEIGNCAFAECTAMTDLLVGAGMTRIGDLAFWNCSNLAYVILGPNVTVIDGGAFDGSGVQELYLGDKVEKIGDAFELCPFLTDVYYAGTQEQWEEIEIDAANTDLQNATIHYEQELPYVPGLPEMPDALPYLTYAVKDGEVTITQCDPSFEGELVIPEQIEGYPVTAIAEFAFSDCIGIGIVMIPGTVTEIGEYAFLGCTGMLLAYMDEGVTCIGQGAFSNNENLMGVFLPTSLETIHDDAFNGCEQFAVVYYSGTQEQWESIAVGSGNEALANAEIMFQWDSEEGPEEYMDGYVTYILEDGEAVAYYCEGEATGTIRIAETIEGCPVTVIDEYAFAWCEGITAVTIPQSVIVIEEGAFYGCIALTDVYYAGTQEQWEEIAIAADNECLADANIHFTGEESDEPSNGDLDGNEAVDEDDVIYLLQHLLMPNDFAVTQSVDYDGSGTVDEDDVIYLLQHLLMPDDFPL